MTVVQRYQILTDRLVEISNLNGALSTLHWDQEVVMPEGATEARAQQISALSGVIHERMTDPAIGECLEALGKVAPGELSALQMCNIREAQRSFDLETKLPITLVKEMAELGSRAHSIWVLARKDNKFSQFSPVLKRFLELKKEWAQYAHPDLKPYDANIDNFEQGTTMEILTPIFEQLKQELIPLIQAIKEKNFQPDTTFLEGTFSIDKQEALGRKISQDIGFRFDRGRMDVAVHPFCGGSHPTDVRITTRYKESDFIESLYAVIHETGHGLYEQGRMANAADLPVSEASTMGIHESQSLFWERMIAQGQPFIRHYFETFRDTFPDNLQSATPESFYKAINMCRPSFIRVEADELTYPLHVILRYEIEMGLFDESIEVDDLPEIWNEMMLKYLGITPPDDRLGVLQDSHWSGGAFGYFPSYTLGAIYACQFYQTLLKEQPNIEQEIAQGDFKPIKNWLNEKIHTQGKLYAPSELVKNVTGEALNPDHFVDYLRDKYCAIYL